MGVLTVSCIQMCSGIDQLRNLEELDWMVRAAAKEGALYIQTPEMTGILQKDGSALMQTITDHEDCIVLAHCEKLAQELGIWLHLGSTAVKVDEQRAANRSVLFSPKGQQAATYDKIHMFDVALGEGQNWRESNRYEAGNKAVVVDTGGFKLGMAICYDIRFSQLFRHHAKAGASILTCPSAFTKPTGKAHWRELLQARAIENGAFMIAAAQGGKHEDGRETYGHSMIIGPWGEVIGELKHDEPGILTADIDLGDVTKAREKIPNLANERKFSISIVDASKD